MLGQSILVVLCAGSTLLLTPVVRPAKSQPATPSKVTRFSYWSIKPWFHTERKLATVLIIPSSWGSQWSALCAHQAFFLAPLPGRRSTSVQQSSSSQQRIFSGAKDFCKGSLSFPISLLCYCFSLLYSVCFVLSKIQKN